ncbi:hypothetical protein ANTPLA_LOCUS251 [Anthophora plagiata]
MRCKVLDCQGNSPTFLPSVRLAKNLRTRKGSRRGNTGNRLELLVLGEEHSDFQGRTGEDEMGHTNIHNSAIKGPYEGVRKEKNGNASSGYQQQSQQQSTNKKDKYGSWGPVYKNKQNFIDMHIC